MVAHEAGGSFPTTETGTEFEPPSQSRTTLLDDDRSCDRTITGTRTRPTPSQKNIMPNVQDEPRPWPARLVLLGARGVTAMVVGSGALLGRFSLVGSVADSGEKPKCEENGRDRDHDANTHD